MYTNYIIACNTDEDVTKVLFKLETEDYRWWSGHKPLQWMEDSHSAQAVLKAPVAIAIYKDKKLGIRDIGHGNISAEEYLSGGKREMKKSDLKTGYLVVTREGHEYVVYLNVLTGYQHNKKSEDIIVCNQGDNRRWDGLDVYNEDLTYKGSKVHKNDIMEVYLLYHPFALQDMSYCEQMRKLLWKREETRELTVKQIEEILGYSIKIIKE